ncbi:hypothetical protein TNCV_1520701 [Trichonephila clavipes]|nr:hypothetical protein TNCV_1520701 [Trichonephila clavipes]
MVAKNDANFAQLPRFRQVSIESPLYRLILIILRSTSSLTSDDLSDLSSSCPPEAKFHKPSLACSSCYCFLSKPVTRLFLPPPRYSLFETQTTYDVLNTGVVNPE